MPIARRAVMRAARGITVASLAMMLIGCPANVRESKIVDEQGLPTGHGIVAVQSVTNAERVFSFLESFDAAIVVPVGAEQPIYRLDKETRGLVRSGVFVGSLPEGQYRIQRFEGTAQFGNMVATASVNMPDLMGTFRVEADHFTQLDTILIQPLSDAEADGSIALNSPFAISRMRSSEDLSAFVAARYQNASRAAIEMPSIGWDADDHDAVRILIADRIRKFAFGQTPFHSKETGGLIIPATLGQIHWRDALGIWHRSETGVTQQITSVVKTPFGWLAGGERGVLLRAQDIRGPWQRIQGPAADQAIVWMGSGGGHVYVIAFSGADFFVYHIDQQSQDWRPIFREKQSTVLGVPVRTVARAWVDDAGRLTQYYNSRKFTFDPISLGTTNKRHKAIWLATRQSDGVVSMLADGLRTDPLFSTDQGETWHELSRTTPRFKLYQVHKMLNLDDSMAWVDEHGTAWAASGGSVKVNGKFYVTRQVYLLSAKPPYANWERGPVMPASCYRILPQASTGTSIVVRCANGSLIQTSDGGTSWEDLWRSEALDLPSNASGV